MTVKLQPIMASDASRPVITLVEAVRSGWQPPQTMDDATYTRLRTSRDQTDPAVCFAGHCCSWGGKWFAGLARSHANQPDPIGTAAKTLVDRVSKVPHTRFSCRDYREVPLDVGDLVYCDPPYAGTINGYAVKGFDHGEFWDWVRRLSRSVTVVVSEYSAPADMLSIWQFNPVVCIRRDDNITRKIEHLWVSSGWSIWR